MLKRYVLLMVVACIAGSCLARPMKGRSETGAEITIIEGKTVGLDDKTVALIERLCGKPLHLVAMKVDNSGGTQDFYWSPLTSESVAQTARSTIKHADIRLALIKKGLPDNIVDMFGTIEVPVGKAGFILVAFDREDQSRIKQVSISDGWRKVVWIN